MISRSGSRCLYLKSVTYQMELWRLFPETFEAPHGAPGCPPANWFIHDLMRFLSQPYYVGILSAAAIHGAAHQQPMLFQVVTDRPTRPAQAGRVRIGFHMGRHIETAPVVEIQTETGSMWVPTSEATAFDLVRFAPSARHIGNVITVLSEIVEKIDSKALTALADLYAISDIQRLGYIAAIMKWTHYGDNGLAL